MAEWRDVRAAFEEALELEPARRAAFLDTRCAGDAELRRQVEQLLSADAATTTGLPIGEPGGAAMLAADVMEAVAGQYIGAYRIQRLLGSGGMSTVFLAEQENPRRQVAVKTMQLGRLSSEAQRRFGYESEVLARLRHPAIAQVYEAGTWCEPLVGSEVPFFAMEYVADALPLDRYVRDKGLDLRTTLVLFAQVCDAVQHGHQQGIIHRDLKPANVMVGPFGEVLVLDWGVAGAIGGGGGASGADQAADTQTPATALVTAHGTVLGTPGYMAPEQAAGLPADVRSDVYGLGAILRDLLAARGEAPPRALAAIRDRALAPAAGERYPDVLAFVDDLRRFQDGLPVAAHRETVLERIGRWISRYRTPIGLVLAYLLVRLLILRLGGV